MLAGAAAVVHDLIGGWLSLVDEIQSTPPHHLGEGAAKHHRLGEDGWTERIHLHTSYTTDLLTSNRDTPSPHRQIVSYAEGVIAAQHALRPTTLFGGDE